MTKLETMLPGLYAEMHAANAFKGDSWEPWAPELYKFLTGWFDADSEDDAAGDPATREGHTVLDFGCGPCGGLAADPRPLGFGAVTVVPYDPYVAQYAADPWTQPITAVFSCDVLEHMPLTAVTAFLWTVCTHVTVQKVMLVIATRAATKVMPNGANAHITVRSGEWWHGFLTAYTSHSFDCVRAKVDLIRGDVMFALTRRPPNAN